VRLHPHYGIFLRIELGPAIVNLNADQVLVELLAVPDKGLLGNEFQEPAFPWGPREVLALKNSAQFFALLKERDRKIDAVDGSHKNTNRVEQLGMTQPTAARYHRLNSRQQTNPVATSLQLTVTYPDNAGYPTIPNLFKFLE